MMNKQELIDANINNLTQLWQRMGASPCTIKGMEQFVISNSWPVRP